MLADRRGESETGLCQEMMTVRPVGEKMAPGKDLRRQKWLRINNKFPS